jgi:Na+-transporting methylmalonyl-CoA/oxaloacetate decarboxylase gamma subunit
MKKVLTFLTMAIFVVGMAVAQTPPANAGAKKTTTTKADTTKKAPVKKHLKKPVKKAAAVADTSKKAPAKKVVKK